LDAELRGADGVRDGSGFFMGRLSARKLLTTMVSPEAALGGYSGATRILMSTAGAE